MQHVADIPLPVWTGLCAVAVLTLLLTRESAFLTKFHRVLRRAASSYLLPGCGFWRVCMHVSVRLRFLQAHWASFTKLSLNYSYFRS
uniref:Uncharacterized protein n=1 Tax=Anguilla anguilla TaxID=7936 RepID=A0A0E9Q569_ANGAN